jgi:hypothetical protein
VKVLTLPTLLHLGRFTRVQDLYLGSSLREEYFITTMQRDNLRAGLFPNVERLGLRKLKVCLVSLFASLSPYSCLSPVSLLPHANHILLF